MIVVVLMQIYVSVLCIKFTCQAHASKLNRTLLFISVQNRLGGDANMSERFYVLHVMTDT